MADEAQFSDPENMDEQYEAPGIDITNLIPEIKKGNTKLYWKLRAQQEKVMLLLKQKRQEQRRLWLELFFLRRHQIVTNGQKRNAQTVRQMLKQMIDAASQFAQTQVQLQTDLSKYLGFSLNASCSPFADIKSMSPIDVQSRNIAHRCTHNIRFTGFTDPLVDTYQKTPLPITHISPVDIPEADTQYGSIGIARQVRKSFGLDSDYSKSPTISIEYQLKSNQNQSQGQNQSQAEGKGKMRSGRKGKGKRGASQTSAANSLASGITITDDQGDFSKLWLPSLHFMQRIQLPDALNPAKKIDEMLALPDSVPCMQWESLFGQTASFLSRNVAPVTDQLRRMVAPGGAVDGLKPLSAQGDLETLENIENEEQKAEKETANSAKGSQKKPLSMDPAERDRRKREAITQLLAESTDDDEEEENPTKIRRLFRKNAKDEEEEVCLEEEDKNQLPDLSESDFADSEEGEKMEKKSKNGDDEYKKPTFLERPKKMKLHKALRRYNDSKLFLDLGNPENPQYVPLTIKTGGIDKQPKTKPLKLKANNIYFQTANDDTYKPIQLGTLKRSRKPKKHDPTRRFNDSQVLLVDPQ